MISFFVPGKPQTQGSKRAFVRHGRAIMMDDKREQLMCWRNAVSIEARKHFSQPADGPVAVALLFYVARPKSHYGTGRNAKKLKDSAPQLPHRKPDLDKLQRAVFDALSGIAYEDDARVTYVEAAKHYSDTPGVQIGIMTTEETQSENHQR